MDLITKTVAAIRNILTPRHHNSERGFVPEFYSELKAVQILQLFPANTILESEVQKRLNDHYGVRQRPDILIHIPIETGLTEHANENNFVVYAFKLQGGNSEADADFGKLDEMFDRLNYETGIYINLNAYPEIYLERYNGNHKNKIHELSVQLNNNQVSVRHAYFNNDVLTVLDI